MPPAADPPGKSPGGGGSVSVRTTAGLPGWTPQGAVGRRRWNHLRRLALATDHLARPPPWADAECAGTAQRRARAHGAGAYADGRAQPSAVDPARRHSPCRVAATPQPCVAPAFPHVLFF
ncbi:unnamed protein product [Lampetra fluviatilis]